LPLVYVLFLRWQYVVSPRTRLVIGNVNQAISTLVAHPSCPPAARDAYATICSYLSIPVLANN